MPTHNSARAEPLFCSPPVTAVFPALNQTQLAMVPRLSRPSPPVAPSESCQRQTARISLTSRARQHHRRREHARCQPRDRRRLLRRRVLEHLRAPRLPDRRRRRLPEDPRQHQRGAVQHDRPRIPRRLHARRPVHHRGRREAARRRRYERVKPDVRVCRRAPERPAAQCWQEPARIPEPAPVLEGGRGAERHHLREQPRLWNAGIPRGCGVGRGTSQRRPHIPWSD